MGAWEVLPSRVTSPEIDWDGAFARAAPRIMAAETDEQALEGVREMLGTLKDPATRLLSGGEGFGGAAIFTITERIRRSSPR